MSQEHSQLDLEIVRRLSQAARTRKGPAEPEEDLIEYDWTVPSHFTRDQKAGLDEFAAQLSSAISEALSKLLRTEIQAEVASVTEHYAAQLRPAEQQSSDFCVELLDNSSRSCGFMALPGAKAFAWVAQLLGGQGSAPDTDRDMSSLEGAILLDIFSTLSGALSQALNAAGGSVLGCGKEISRGPCGLDESDAEEYCKITFQDPAAQDQPGICLVILSDSLEPVVGGSETAEGTQSSSAEDSRKDMINHLQHVPVVVEAYLGTAVVKVRNLTELQPGDVLLTQRKVDEAMDIFVQGKKVFWAYPAVCEGRYALRFVQMAQS